MKNSVDVSIFKHTYVLTGEESEEHLREVAEMVKRKVEHLRKKAPNISLQKAAMLAAFDFASDTIKGKKKAVEYRSTVIAKASELLDRVELEIASKPSI